MQTSDADQILTNILIHNVRGCAIPAPFESLLDMIGGAIESEFGLKGSIFGSYASRTAVATYSDFDLFYLLNNPEKRPEQQFLVDLTLGISGLLEEKICSPNIKSKLDLPSLVYYMPSIPEWKVEINIGVESPVLLGAPCEYQPDFLILTGRDRSVTHTNPVVLRTVTDYLRNITDERYSMMATLLKLWKYRNDIPVSSYIIEHWAYYFFRGIDLSLTFDEAVNGKVNLDFSPLHMDESLFDNFIGLFAKAVDLSERNDDRMVSPFLRIRMPKCVYPFQTPNEKQTVLKALKNALSILDNVKKDMIPVHAGLERLFCFN